MSPFPQQLAEAAARVLERPLRHPQTRRGHLQRLGTVAICGAGVRHHFHPVTNRWVGHPQGRARRHA